MANKANKGSFKPGDERAGRPKGVPNQATAAVRTVITAFVKNNAAKVQGLFDQVAADSPAKALELYARIAEFVIPKQHRTEIDAEVGTRATLTIERDA